MANPCAQSGFTIHVATPMTILVIVANFVISVVPDGRDPGLRQRLAWEGGCEVGGEPRK
jgi:hypothetical protein